MHKLVKLVFILSLFFRLNLFAEIVAQNEQELQVALNETVVQQADINILTECEKTFLEDLVFYIYEKPKEFFIENKKLTLVLLLLGSYVLRVVDDNRWVFYEQDEAKEIFVRKKYKNRKLSDIPENAVKEVDNGNNDLPGNESEDEL